mmetsp:Transcript_76261/g.202633  ORF Transcript_76261/g.202633 Transcript_76261/m.202633 type:complete len:161 (+) Transcript_76261:76-558(+)
MWAREPLPPLRNASPRNSNASGRCELRSNAHRSGHFTKLVVSFAREMCLPASTGDDSSLCLSREFGARVLSKVGVTAVTLAARAVIAGLGTGLSPTVGTRCCRVVPSFLLLSTTAVGLTALILAAGNVHSTSDPFPSCPLQPDARMNASSRRRSKASTFC